jgi:hypothetical protein
MCSETLGVYREILNERVAAAGGVSENVAA